MVSCITIDFLHKHGVMYLYNLHTQYIVHIIVFLNDNRYI
nr:MAG TPA: hypothetical protein [Caudoviricetes sp.]